MPLDPHLCGRRGFAHLVHKPLAGNVLAIGSSRASAAAQLRRQSDRQAHRQRADVALDRDERPAIARRHDVLLDRGLEVVVMRGDAPVGIARGLDDFRRHRIAGNPKLHRTIIDGVSEADAPRWKDRSHTYMRRLSADRRGSAFEITMEDVPSARAIVLRCGSGSCIFAAPAIRRDAATRETAQDGRAG